jgi:ABC-type Fe3+-hydroxamate transport system substrate-binding protein
MRLVSLCPSLTELLFELGAGDEVVARTRFCIHPADGVAAVEIVGGTKNPKVARIIALQPDLVLMNEEENRVEDARTLADAGLRVHASLPRTAADTAAMVRSVGAAIGRTPAAERVAHEIEAAAEASRELARGRPQVRFAYLIWREPWMAAAGDTYVSDLLSLAGGVNVLPAGGDRYPTLTLEDLRAHAPDVILLSTEPFPFAERHADQLSAATGLARERFRVVDGELLSWHGSRTPAGIAYAAHVLRG